MDGIKEVTKSRSVISSLVGMAAMLLQMSGIIELTFEDQKQIIDALTGLVAVGSYIAAIYFRIVARHTLVDKLPEGEN